MVESQKTKAIKIVTSIFERYNLIGWMDSNTWREQNFSAVEILDIFRFVGLELKNVKWFPNFQSKKNQKVISTLV